MFAKNNQISGRQTTRLLVFELLGYSALLVPSALAQTAGRDGIFSIALGVVAGFLYLRLLKTLLTRMRGNYSDCLTVSCKTVGGNLLKAGYLVYFLLLAGRVTSVFAELVVKELLEKQFSLISFLIVILVWVSVNVTNCSDGVDGLSGTLTIITIMTIYVLTLVLERGEDFSFLILIFAVCILGYLWYNATPSRLMMGDAGSRAMGLFISIAILKTGSPLLYIPVALVLILDGGLGLVKVALLRFLKIHILKNTRTPLHDQVRKVWGWSNTQCVYRFAIIQIIVAVATVYAVGL